MKDSQQDKRRNFMFSKYIKERVMKDSQQG